MNAAASKLREWREKPQLFVRQVFGVTPDGWQDEALDAFTKHNRLALKACKGPGKSTFKAWLLLLYLATRPHPKVVATSITGSNLRDGLWTEVAKWQQKSDFLKQAFQWSAERIVNKQHPETWWASARQWSQSADPNQQANTLAGIHADFVLFLIDEAGGIPDAVVATAEAALANANEEEGREAKLVIGGNPTETSGPLYRACTRERRLWWVKEISSAPNDPQRTPRVSVQWAQEQIDKYGWDSPFVLVNVRGEFPPSQSNTLLGVEDVGQASRRVISEAEWMEAPKVLGVDVARFGDDKTVLCPRQGRACFRMKDYRNLNTMETADRVAMFIDKWQPDATFIDVTGIGAGVVDRLHQLGHPVVGVDFGSKPSSGKFINKRGEMWWEMADWVKAGGCIPDDPELLGELPGPTYSFDASGRLRLETKEEMKQRGLPSPNKGDALALTFAAPVARREFHLPGQPRHGAVYDYNPYQDGA